MAIDTEQKRISAIGVGIPFRGALVWAPDTGTTQGNRQAAAFYYSGILATEAVVAYVPPIHLTAILDLTVDLSPSLDLTVDRNSILDLEVGLAPVFDDGSKALLGARFWAPDSVEDWEDPGLDAAELARYFWWAKDNGRLSDGTKGYTWK